MQRLGAVTDAGVGALGGGDTETLATLMAENFGVRKSIYTISPRNLLMESLLSDFGFAAKFTGSGGAMVCLRPPSRGGAELTTEEEAAVTSALANEGMDSRM